MARCVTTAVLLLQVLAGPARAQKLIPPETRDSIWEAVLQNMAATTLGPAFLRSGCRLAERRAANFGALLFEPDSVGRTISGAWLTAMIRDGLLYDWCFAKSPAQCPGSGDFEFLRLGTPRIEGDSAEIRVGRIRIWLPEGWYGQDSIRYHAVRSHGWTAEVAAGSRGRGIPSCGGAQRGWFRPGERVH